MKKINSIEKALEYLAMNNKGEKVYLDKIDEILISKIIEAGFLEVNQDKYVFNEQGIDFYSREYGMNKKTNFLGM